MRAARRIALGHRRLAIIDRSDAGQQPMPNEDDSVWIPSNGEVYNHVAPLRRIPGGTTAGSLDQQRRDQSGSQGGLVHRCISSTWSRSQGKLVSSSLGGRPR